MSETQAIACTACGRFLTVGVHHVCSGRPPARRGEVWSADSTPTVTQTIRPDGPQPAAQEAPCEHFVANQPAAQEAERDAIKAHQDDPHDGHGWKAFEGCLEGMHRRGRAEEREELELLRKVFAVHQDCEAVQDKYDSLRAENARLVSQWRDANHQVGYKMAEIDELNAKLDAAERRWENHDCEKCQQTELRSSDLEEKLAAAERERDDYRRTGLEVAAFMEDKLAAAERALADEEATTAMQVATWQEMAKGYREREKRLRAALIGLQRWGRYDDPCWCNTEPPHPSLHSEACSQARATLTKEGEGE